MFSSPLQLIIGLAIATVIIFFVNWFIEKKYLEPERKYILSRVIMAWHFTIQLAIFFIYSFVVFALICLTVPSANVIVSNIIVMTFFVVSYAIGVLLWVTLIKVLIKKFCKNDIARIKSLKRILIYHQVIVTLSLIIWVTVFS